MTEENGWPTGNNSIYTISLVTQQTEARHYKGVCKEPPWVYLM